MSSRTYAATRYAGDTGVSTSSTAVGDESNDANAGLFAARALSVPVDFGISSDRCFTTVLLVPWIKASRRPLAQCVGRPLTVSGGFDDEDALVGNVRALVTNIVEGVSCDVVAYSEGGASGVFTIQVNGV
mgnify:CR=1 FL=1